MTLRAQVLAGIVAGVAGAIAIEVCLIGNQLLEGASAATIAGSFAFIAATVMGPAAYHSAAAVPLGVVMHFAVAIGWAFGYVYLVRTQPQLLSRPIVSGLGFGVVVYVFMQIVLLTAGLYHRAADPRTLGVQLLAHLAFYGLPVALIVSRMLRPAASAAR